MRQQFQYHVDECVGVLGFDIAGNDNQTSVSTLSTPPLSPSHQTQSSVRDDLEDVDDPPTTGDQIVVSQLHVQLEDILSNFTKDFLDPIRPYVNRSTEFEYYEPSIAGDSVEVETQTSNPVKTSGNDNSPAPSLELDSVEVRAEVSENAETSSSAPSIEVVAKSETGPKPAPGPKYKFAKLTHPDHFETYLENPEDMTYEELYEHTAKVSYCLVSWQKEWDDAQKQIYAYETIQKAEKSRAEDKAKAEAEELRILDDQARDRVREKYRVQLSLKGQEWADFLDEIEKVDIDPVETLRHLSNLKNPQFMAQVNKKRRPTRQKEVRFENMPLPESKPTKDEINFEKRKRGRLVDPIRFDDMKQADVYGFEYSAHNKHHGAQPLGSDSSRTAQKKKKAQAVAGTDPANSEIDVTSTGRTRAPRNKTKRAYGEIDADGTPDSDEEGVSGRRTRKPKYLHDGSESASASRSQSRGGTPSVKTFASGKRVGRPPAKSKLQAVQMAPKSPSPGQGNLSQDLPPLQKAQLQEAAESLVNQTVSDKAEKPPVKKHAGGRPRKSVLASKAGAMDNIEIPIGVPKPKNKGGRPKKNQAQGGSQSSVKAETASYDSTVQLGEENGVLQSTEQNDGSQDQHGSPSSGRSKRKRTTAETDDSPLVVDSAPAQTEEKSSKRRKTRTTSRATSRTGSQSASLAPSQTTDELEEEDISEENVKHKRSTTTSQPATPSAPSQQGEEELTGKKRKGGAIKSGQAQKKVKTEFPDLDIDESTLDPAAREELRKARVAMEKSRKLSESMKNRWAMGGMKKAQETRLANNALKKAAKEAEASRAPIQPIPATSHVQLATPVPVPIPYASTILPLEIAPAPRKSTILKLPLTGAPKISAIKPPEVKTLASKAPLLEITTPKATSSKKPAAKRSKIPPPPRAASTRAKKPNKSFGGLDGADDSDDEEGSENQFASEYDTFLALTSPGNRVELGKRIPKRKAESVPYIDDEEEDEFHSTEQTEEDDYSFES